MLKNALFFSFILLYLGMVYTISTRDEDKITYLRALDCRSPRKIRSTLLRKVCDSSKSVESQHKTDVAILQVSNKHVLKAYRCEKHMNIHREICGFSSHTKLYGPPEINIPVLFDVEDCLLTVKRMSYQREDNINMPIMFNKIFHYTFVRHGELHMTENDISCQGSSYILKGKIVSSMVEMISANIIIKEVDLEVNHISQTAIDLDLHFKLPSVCIRDEKCQVGQTSYLLTPIPQCNLYHIQTLVMEQMTITTDKGPKPILISHKHKILLELKEQEKAHTGCKITSDLTATNFKSIKVLIGEQGSINQSGNQFSSSILNIDLEMRVSENYLVFLFEDMLTKSLGSAGKRLCNLQMEGWSKLEVSPFHSDSLIRVRGDLIQELICTPQKVEIRIGEKRGDLCYANSIPGWIGSEPILVQAVTHLVLNSEEISQVDCKATYPPVFEASGNILVQAYPEVQIVDLSLTHQTEGFLHLDETDDKHHLYNGDLLYTSGEIEQFNTLIHFQRTRARILDNIVTHYCSNTDCGSYQPSQTSSFNLDNLKKVVSSPFSFLQTWKQDIETFGSYCSIIIVLLISISLLFKISRFIWLLFFHRLGFGQAMKLGLCVDSALIAELVNSTPNDDTRSPANLHDPTDDIPLVRCPDPREEPLASEAPHHPSPTTALVPYYPHQWR